jgi:hypothetical protein
MFEQSQHTAGISPKDSKSVKNSDTLGSVAQIYKYLLKASKT